MCQRPRLGVCDNAEPAADFAALDAVLLASVLLAAFAAAALVCLLLRVIRLTSSRTVLRAGTRGDLLSASDACDHLACPERPADRLGARLFRRADLPPRPNFKQPGSRSATRHAANRATSAGHRQAALAFSRELHHTRIGVPGTSLPVDQEE